MKYASSCTNLFILTLDGSMVTHAIVAFSSLRRQSPGTKEPSRVRSTPQRLKTASCSKHCHPATTLKQGKVRVSERVPGTCWRKPFHSGVLNRSVKAWNELCDALNEEGRNPMDSSNSWRAANVSGLRGGWVGTSSSAEDLEAACRSNHFSINSIAEMRPSFHAPMVGSANKQKREGRKSEGML